MTYDAVQLGDVALAAPGQTAPVNGALHLARQPPRAVNRIAAAPAHKRLLTIQKHQLQRDVRPALPSSQVSDKVEELSHSVHSSTHSSAHGLAHSSTHGSAHSPTHIQAHMFSSQLNSQFSAQSALVMSNNTNIFKSPKRAHDCAYCSTCITMHELSPQSIYKDNKINFMYR